MAFVSLEVFLRILGVSYLKVYKNMYNEEINSFVLQQTGRRRRAEYDDGVPRIKIASPSP